MTQTLALLIDAYREMNARKMFWISLIISALVVAAFAFLGVTDSGLKLFTFDMPMPNARQVYVQLFSGLVIGIWVTFGAIILALISTASVFPDFIAAGSIDLYLSKPISRLRLFLTKYLGGLLFVLLQTVVFAVCGYLVLGLRAGEWRPAMFLLIPLTTLLFSYLFAFCVLIGVLTRSTLAAILLTVLFWVLCFVVNTTEQALFQFRAMQTTEQRENERLAREADAEIAHLRTRSGITNFFGMGERRVQARKEQNLRRAAEARERARKLNTAHRIVYGIATAVPKTGETIDLLNRKLFTEADERAVLEGQRGAGRTEEPAPPDAPVTAEAEAAATLPSATNPSEEDQAAEQERKRDQEEREQIQLEAMAEAARAARSRSVPWILGTSIGFEVVVLALAAWVFCRRDY